MTWWNYLISNDYLWTKLAFFLFLKGQKFTIDVIPSILYGQGEESAIFVGTIIIGHPVLIEEGCRELWKFLDTKDNYLDI